jgi:hypothetical protein
MTASAIYCLLFYWCYFIDDGSLMLVLVQSSQTAAARVTPILSQSSAFW